MKTCNHCNIEKSLDDFYKCGDSYRNECKLCNKLLKKEYYIKNTEKLKLNSKEYKELNPEYVKKMNSKYYNSETQQKYRLKNPEQTREYSRKRRALKLEVNENYTKEDEQFTRDLFNNKCFNCDSTKELCLDHTYPLSKGFPMSINNCTLLCRSCNSGKGAKLPREFYSSERLEELTEIYKQFC